MTSANQALIEEGRRTVSFLRSYDRDLVSRLADALEAEMTARRDLADKIEALRHIIKEVLPINMGGTPDLFAPECEWHGIQCEDPWECWADRAQRCLVSGDKERSDG